MANVFFDCPPLQTGDEAQYLQALYGYLHRMSDQLNVALNSISGDQLAPEVQVEIRQGQMSSDGADKTDLARQAAQLKELIIKNAEIVEVYREEISTELEEYSKHISEEFGTLETKILSDIDVTARRILMEYNIEETLQANDENLQEFITKVSSYIYMGILDSGETGIAIGENLVNEDGSLRSDNQTATFTKDRLGFWQGGNEVAYFSNNEFHINEGIIDLSLRMGNHIWKVLSNGAIALMRA